MVEVDRDGKRHRMEFAKGGKPQDKLEVVGEAPRGRTGTTVTFWPDPDGLRRASSSAPGRCSSACR